MEFFSRINGRMNYEKEDVIIFKKPIPGFNELRKFVLIDLTEYQPFKILQSLEDDQISLLVVSPYEFFKDYEVKLQDDTIKNLEISEPDQVIILTTVTLNSDVDKITTNLQGPIVINISNKFGEQIILNNPKYKVKNPLR